jgi:PKD repeat protein
MKKTIHTLSIFLLLQITSVGIVQAGDFLPNDTLFFDLSSAVYSAEGLNSYVEFPVYISGPNDTVNAIDFWFPFDTDKLTFISAESEFSLLDVYSNYIIANETLSSTASTSSIFSYLPDVTTLITVKFQLNSPCDRIDMDDLIDPIVLINGLEAAYVITEPTPLTLPDVQIISQSPFCPNAPISFSYTGQINGQSINNYSWDFGNNVTATGQSPAATLEQEGAVSFSLTMTTGLGCIYETSSTINVSPAPVASFTNTIVTNTTNVEFTSTSTISGGSITGYEWNFGDNSAVSTEQDPSHTFPASGPFQVTLTATSDLGCTGEVTTTVDVPVGIENLTKQAIVVVYPNPAESNLFIMSDKTCQFVLTDQCGKLITSGNLPGFAQQTLSVEEYATGIYNLTLVSEGSTQSVKVAIR